MLLASFDATDGALLIAELGGAIQLGSWAAGLPLRRAAGGVWRAYTRDPQIVVVRGPRGLGRELDLLPGEAESNAKAR